MAPEVFTQRFPVASADIDELGHVNNIVYLRWAQEIATAHWRARAPQEMVEKHVWVVTRHEADYRSPLQLGDDVDVRTWVAAAAQGAVWARFVEIRAAGADKPAAEIKSYWCLLDAATRRPKRVPASLPHMFFVQNTG